MKPKIMHNSNTTELEPETTTTSLNFFVKEGQQEDRTRTNKQQMQNLKQQKGKTTYHLKRKTHAFLGQIFEILKMGCFRYKQQV